jgi:hypothetical protein
LPGQPGALSEYTQEYQRYLSVLLFDFIDDHPNLSLAVADIREALAKRPFENEGAMKALRDAEFTTLSKNHPSWQ